MLLGAEERAVALRDEFRSVGIPAEHIAPGAFTSDHTVRVETRTIPPVVNIAVANGYRWTLTVPADELSSVITHSHDLPRRMPASDVAELVAICVSRHCGDVTVLKVSQIPG